MASNDNQALLLQVSADTSKAEKRLQGLIDKLNGVEKKVQQTGAKSQTALDKFFGNPGKGLDQIFDSTRLRALDTGAARIGITGSALEKFGIAGLGAAAAIGALAFALNRAGEAIKFADAIGDTADKLHISTDALQEWRGALQLAGGEEANADGALEAFSITLGKAQAGLPKAIKGFKELGFTKEQIKGFSDTGDALSAVIAKIAGIKNSGQRDAVISQFGLDGLKQLIDKGPEGVERFTEEIRKSGGVMDAELIKRAGKLQDQIEVLNRKIKVDLHSSFVDLGPLLLDLLNTVARITGGIERFLAKLQPLRNRSDKDLQAERDDFTRQAFNAQSARGQKNEGNPFFINQAANANAKAAEIRAEQERRVAERQADAAAKKKEQGGGSLIDLEAQKEAAAAAKKSAEQIKKFNDELARAGEAVLAAMDDEFHTLDQRQAIARERLRTEDTARIQAIDDQVATGEITKAQGERLKIAQDDVFIAKANQLTAKQEKEQRELLLKRQQDVASAMAEYLNAQIGLAGTAEERGQLEAEILVAQRALARKILENQLTAADVSPFQKAFQLGIFDRTTGLLGEAQDKKTAQSVSAEALSVAQAELDARIKILQTADQLADTAAERRDIELKILDLQYQQQRAQLEAVIATSESVAEIRKAKIDLKALNDTHPGTVQGVINSTRGPLEQMAAGLPTTAARMNEALQNVAEHGLQSLEDGLVQVISHTKKLGDVFREVAASIIADLARIAIQRAIIAPLESAISLGLSSLPGAASRIFGGARAGGGPVDFGRTYLVGEKGPELFVPGVSGSIVSNDSVRRAASMSGGPGPMILQEFHLHAEGAVMTDQLIAGLRRDAAVIATVKAEQAAGRAVRGMPGALANYQNHSG
jgi:hypothetical protein